MRSGKWFASYRSALAHRDLRLLFGGLVISASGSWAYNAGLLAFVYERTHSLGWIGAAGTVRFLTSLVGSAYGGVIAERLERIRLMVSLDLLCVVWQLGLAIVAFSGAPVWLALVFTVLTSATAAPYPPSVAATIPEVVTEDALIAANALNATIDNLVVIVGPAIGALLLVFGSPGLVFLVNAGSFLVSAAIVSQIRTRTKPVDVTEEGTAGPLRQTIVGIKAIASLPAARTLVAYSVLVSFVYGTDTVLFIGVSTDKLGTGPKGFGYLLAGLGIGGVLMALAIDRLASRSRLSLIIIAGVAGYTLPTALLTVVHSPAVAVAIQVLRGASTLVVDVLAITALQRAVPREQLARVFGAFFAFVLGAIVIGTILTPIIAHAAGLDAAILTMAFAPFAVGLLGYPALLAVDRQTVVATEALAPKVALLEQLGIFATANRSLLERLAAEAPEEAFAAGSVIVREGDPAENLFVLSEGEVRVTAHGEVGGADKVLRTMEAPTYFGEIGVLRQIPRTATVTAQTDCRCWLIDGGSLLEALNATPASPTLMATARTRLAATHPSLRSEDDGEAVAAAPVQSGDA